MDARPLPPTAAVLLAAGRSSRMGSEVRKPFLELAGRTVLEHCVRAFAAVTCLRQLVVVASEGDEALVEQLTRAHFAGELQVVRGGAERTDSVRCGVAAVGEESEVVLVHDVARCLVRPGHVEEVAEVAAREGSALLAVPVRDTVKEVAGSRSERTLDRSRLWAAQTPQGFRTSVLRELLERAARDDGFTPTDDAALHERYMGPVPIVEGEPDNLKLTTPSDLAIAGAILQSRDPS